MTQSGYSQDTTRIQSGYSQYTDRIHPTYNQDTARIQPGYSQDTARMLPGYSQDTARIQQDTARVRPGYSRIQLLNFTPTIILYFAKLSHPFANILPFNIHFSHYFSFLFHISPFLS
jgi:hypothetical protein